MPRCMRNAVQRQSAQSRCPSITPQRVRTLPRWSVVGYMEVVGRVDALLLYKLLLGDKLADDTDRSTVIWISRLTSGSLTEQSSQ